MTMGRTHGGQLLQLTVNATGLVMVAHRLPSTPASSLAGSWQSRKLDHWASRSWLLPDLPSVSSELHRDLLWLGGKRSWRWRPECPGGQRDGQGPANRWDEAAKNGGRWWCLNPGHRGFMNGYSWDVLPRDVLVWGGMQVCPTGKRKPSKWWSRPKQTLQVWLQGRRFCCKSLAHHDLWLYRGQVAVREGPDLFSKHHMVRLFLQLCYICTYGNCFAPRQDRNTNACLYRLLWGPFRFQICAHDCMYSCASIIEGQYPGASSYKQYLCLSKLSSKPSDVRACVHSGLKAGTVCFMHSISNVHHLLILLYTLPNDICLSGLNWSGRHRLRHVFFFSSSFPLSSRILENRLSRGIWGLGQQG